MKPFSRTKIVDEMPDNCTFRFTGKSILNGETVSATCKRDGDKVNMVIDGQRIGYRHTPDTLHDEFDDHVYRVDASQVCDIGENILWVCAVMAEKELKALNEHFDLSDALARVSEIRESLETFSESQGCKPE